MCSNAPTNFYEKSKIISNCDFQHIDKALKPRPCALFSLQSHLLVKVSNSLLHYKGEDDDDDDGTYKMDVI